MGTFRLRARRLFTEAAARAAIRSVFSSVPMMMKYRLAALAALVLPVSAFAQAQDKPPRTLTRDELRVCIDGQMDIAARRAAIDARRQKSAPEVAAMRAEQAELDEEKKNIREDEYQKQERFNRKVRMHNTKFEPVRKNALEIEADVGALAKAVGAYNEKCVGVAFNPEDREAILKERAAAGK
jgi:hypothetical protein